MKRTMKWTCLAVVFLLTGCGRESEESVEEKELAPKTSLISGVDGVDDRSFNQAGWEGLDKWGKEHGLKARKTTPMSKQISRKTTVQTSVRQLRMTTT
ncbi:hypothetical protein NRIC_06330 [Enterococcus florum]|uniref:Uncharacterized protein n=1 Tax=Enterococcus florum TaxID=2480627 RepID=A0A4P5PBC5_9ENTE|nr:hypothetical protein NRIC_06330 [Enterococcus florum]